MTVQIPQGMLSLYEVIGRLVRRKFPDKDHTDKVEGEEAWRELCKHILAGRIRPYVLTESNESYEANCAQFVALQERYIFFADMLRYWSDEEQRYHYTEGDGPITDTLRDVDGHNKRGQLSFRESDLEALAEGSPENPSPGAVPVPRKLPASCNQKLREFLHTLGPCNEKDAWKKAEAHFAAKILRSRIRAMRTIKGKAGRPRSAKAHGGISPVERTRSAGGCRAGALRR